MAWTRLLTRSLPLLPIAFLAIIVLDLLTDFDQNSKYIRNTNIVDSAAGWFPIIWIVFVAIPFVVAAILCARYGRPSNLYWKIVLATFVALTGLGLFLDSRVWNHFCRDCAYTVPGL